MANNNQTKEVKNVVFQNIKVFAGRRRPHHHSGYTDENGIKIIFAEIPLYNEDGTDRWTTNQKGDKIRVVYGEKMDWSKGDIKSFHPVIHKDVIKYFRDWGHCVTSKHPNRTRGLIQELEPEREAAAEEAAAVSMLDVFGKASELTQQDETNNFELICAYLQITGRNKGERIKKFTKFIGTDHGKTAFMATLMPKKVEIKRDLKSIAIVRFAVHKNILVQGADMKWRLKGDDSSDFGVDSSIIHVEYSGKIGAIVEVLQRNGSLKKLGGKKPVTKKAEGGE